MLGLLQSLVGFGNGFPSAFMSRRRARAALRRASSSRLVSLVEVFCGFRVVFLMPLKVVQGSVDLNHRNTDHSSSTPLARGQALIASMMIHASSASVTTATPASRKFGFAPVIHAVGP